MSQLSYSGDLLVCFATAGVSLEKCHINTCALFSYLLNDVRQTYPNSGPRATCCPEGTNEWPSQKSREKPRKKVRNSKDVESNILASQHSTTMQLVVVNVCLVVMVVVVL